MQIFIIWSFNGHLPEEVECDYSIIKEYSKKFAPCTIMIPAPDPDCPDTLFEKYYGEWNEDGWASVIDCLNRINRDELRYAEKQKFKPNKGEF